jgi:hypothetical protein
MKVMSRSLFASPLIFVIGSGILVAVGVEEGRQNLEQD